MVLSGKAGVRPSVQACSQRAYTRWHPSDAPAPYLVAPAHCLHIPAGMRADSGIDMTRKEDYLSPADFRRVGAGLRPQLRTMSDCIYLLLEGFGERGRGGIRCTEELAGRRVRTQRKRSSRLLGLYALPHCSLVPWCRFSRWTGPSSRS